MIKFFNVLNNVVVILLCSFLLVSMIFGMATVIFLLAVN